jgi:vacuolar-type H+-ATPase subunit F/Vma7
MRTATTLTWRTHNPNTTDRVAVVLVQTQLVQMLETRARRAVKVEPMAVERRFPPSLSRF